MPLPRSLLLFVGWLLALACLAPPSSAWAEKATRIYAGVYLHDVTKFDQKDGVFDVDMEVWAKWLGEFDKDKLKIANAAEVERTLIGEERDGEWHSARWHVKGTLRGEFPVQQFPFDEQTLRVVLELPGSEGELAPDLAGSGMHERFSVTGWLYEPLFVPRVGQQTYRSDLGSIDGEGRPTVVSRAAFEVKLRRPVFTAVTKLFVPLLVILLVAMIALMIHPKWLDVRAGVGVTALLACFAFQFSVADTMPSVAYMTVADVLFLAGYFLTATTLFVSVVASWLHDKNRPRDWRLLDKLGLIGVPFILFVTVLIAASKPADKPPPPPPPLAGERPASSRDVVRIGVNALATVTGGIAGRSTNWGTTRSELDGTTYAALSEEVPGITNDALRFRASGHLEVTWTLRPHLKWSDGKPLTAEDFAFALEVSPDPRIESIKVLSPRKLWVRYTDRVAKALENITPMPKSALKDVFKEGGYEAVREYRRTHVLPSTGPYRAVEFVVEDHCLLEANPHFAGPAPSIKRIELKKYADDAALVRAFEAKEIDMIAPNAITPETAAQLAKKNPAAVAIKPSEVVMFLHPDPNHPLLKQVAVRKALLSAIDRENIAKEIFGADAKVAAVPVVGAAPKGAEATKRDPDAAKAALEKAGAAGATIPLFHGERPVEKMVAERVAKDAAAVGLVLELKREAKLGDLFRKRKHGGLLLTQTTGERDSEPEKYWAVLQKDGKYDRSYRTDAFDDAILALVEREERALYPERREQVRDMLFAEHSKRLPTLPLFFLVDATVADPALDGWQAGSGVNFGTTVERWYFKPEP